jgi:RNA polymerase sigma-70 factor (ECF subfamily)
MIAILNDRIEGASPIPFAPSIMRQNSSVTIAALEKCYFDNYNKLVGLARTLVDDIETAEEVVQHVFTKAAQNHIHIQGDIMSYIRIGVVNESRSQLRKRRTQRKHLRTVTVEPVEVELEALSSQSLMLKNALDTLPRRQRECLSLAYVENLTHQEIALALGISLGSVKQHISRAVAALHAQLKDES